MHITVLIPSRNRPASLVCAVMTLWRLRSGHYDLSFVIGTDSDDQKMGKIGWTFKNEDVPVTLLPGRRASSLGGVINRSLQTVRKGPADIVALMGDRMNCITPEWDQAIASGVLERSDRVLWWSSPNEKSNVAPIFSRRWLDAIDWKISCERFPFWFDDSWLEEIDLLVNGPPSLKVRASFAGARGTTTRARDFAFWINAFIAMRSERRVIAAKIAQHFNAPAPNAVEIEQLLAHRDSQLISFAPGYEERFADPRPPSREYFQIKASVEEWLKENAGSA